MTHAVLILDQHHETREKIANQILRSERNRGPQHRRPAQQDRHIDARLIEHRQASQSQDREVRETMEDSSQCLGSPRVF